MKTRLVLAALLGAAAAQAQTFSLESALIDSRDAKNLGVAHESGEIAQLFKAQKELTFAILRAAGVPVEQMSPELRARIERFQTTNLAAFRAFSRGLDLEDQGRYGEAKAAFAQAAALDPGFLLASEKQRAMPDINVEGGLQMRAVVAQAAGTAVASGKASYTVDLAHAVAAISAGQSVTATTVPVPTEQIQSANAAGAYTANAPGSSSQYQSALAVGVSYNYTTTALTSVGIANNNEWSGGSYTTAPALAAGAPTQVLVSVGSPGGFYAQQLGATNVPVGSTTLADGTKAYWGSWISAPGASAAVTVISTPGANSPSTTALQAPVLGQVDYAFGNATLQMPISGKVDFSPSGGSLGNVSGSISVDFAQRTVGLNSLGFSIGNLVFSGLTGSTTYSGTVASGAFQGNYTAGNCLGCVAFNPQSSIFGGNFIGKDAAGLVFSTNLLTGSGVASGVHVFQH